MTWTIGGACLMLALAALVLTVLQRLDVLTDPPRPLALLGGAGKVWVFGSLALGFLAGGVAIGKVSEGRTILEAALAAAFALGLLIWFVNRRALVDLGASPDQLTVGVSCAVAIGLSTAGAWLGEHWQG